MPADFSACAAANVPLSRELIELYGYTGPVYNIPQNRTTQITLAGCKALCGNGTDWYPWGKQASTLTTWIFPIIGILLQAPFTSNAFWATVSALARWIGNPMASLSVILWNIKVAGKCALLVDMSVPFGARSNILLRDDNDYASIRDSFYLLNVMNQYTMRSHVRQKKEAEGLLRVVLFSKDLRLLKEDPALKATEPMLRGPSNSAGRSQQEPAGRRDTSARRAATSPRRPDLEPERHLDKLRRKLADDLRAARKRGVVPVYLSLLWFLFSLAISIQGGFGLLGLNSEAHDLALGCLLSWLPVLILCSVVDRNPVDPENIREELNRLVDRVRCSLMDKHVREMYLKTITDPMHKMPMRDGVDDIAGQCNAFGDFFVEFAGQGRTRWHYGCAHPILKDIERAYIAEKGRDWLRHEHEARTLLVLGDVTGGLDWLDYRELWQVLAAVLIVGGTTFGAFCLSYFTPTVGLGCRSGGYVIFVISCFALLLTEMIIWWIMDARKAKIRQWLEPWRYRRNATTSRRDAEAMRNASRRRARLNKFSEVLTFVPKAAHKLIRTIMPESVATKLQNVGTGWKESTTPEKLQSSILRPWEAANAIWLIYIVCAQTFGAYNTCECMTSAWSNQNYMDFSQYSTTNNEYVRLYWIGGTVVSVLTMSFALCYIVLQWCLQSHMSTLDRGRAARGLRMVQRFRVLTMPLLWMYRLLPRAAVFVLSGILRVLQHCGLRWVPPSNCTLRWTKEVTCNSPGRDTTRRGRSTVDIDPPALVVAPDHPDSESIPLVVQPDFVHLHDSSSGHTPRTSGDRSISPTARDHR